MWSQDDGIAMVASVTFNHIVQPADSDLFGDQEGDRVPFNACLLDKTHRPTVILDYIELDDNLHKYVIFS